METHIEPPEEEDYDHDRYVQRVKEGVIRELSDLLVETGHVANASKLFRDMWNREKKASTAVGHNLAIPHIRTQQIKDVILGFARSTDGYDFGAPDGEKVHIFVVIAGSSFDSETYLKLYRGISEMFRFDAVRERLFEAWSEGEVYRLFDGKY